MIAFVRHGQTELNRGGRLQGRIDAPLSDLGLEQAARAGAASRVGAGARVFEQPAARARDTAAAIAAAHGLAVEVDDRLDRARLRRLGRPGRSPTCPPDDWARVADRPGVRAARRRAARRASPQRVASFCADAARRDDLVVAVSHVSPIKAAVCARSASTSGSPGGCSSTSRRSRGSAGVPTAAPT